MGEVVEDMKKGERKDFSSKEKFKGYGKAKDMMRPAKQR